MRFVDAAAVAAALDFPTLVKRLEDGFRTGCEMPQRHRHTVVRTGEPDSSLVLMPAWQPDGKMGVKLTRIVPGNATRDLPTVMPIYVVFDPVTGAPQTIVEGRSLTLHRTAATSALAATYLAREDASRLLVVGTGALASFLARAHSSVRPIRDVIIWGRRPQRARDVVEALAHLGQPARVSEDLASAVASADIISCATSSKDPLVRGDWIRPGTHLDLVGGFTPEMREADDAAVAKARIFVDRRESCLVEAGDLTQPLAGGVIERASILGDLFDLAAGRIDRRRSAEEITLFKSTGIALEDLVAASLVLERTL